jgi:hypothetical protein
MMANFVIGLFLVLLPSRFRHRWFSNWHGNLRTSAMLSGIAQILSALAILVLRYPHFAERQMAQIDPRVFIAAAEQSGESAVRGFGLIVLLAYVIQPLTVLLGYFAIEGVVRLIGAVGTGEVVGTLPLTLIEKAIYKWSAHQAEKMQGARVPDLVSPPAVDGSGYDLAISSCRCKPEWDHLTTISYDDKLYVVADYIEGDTPRKHVYLLRYAPAHKVVRGLHHYDPEEVLAKED